MKRILLGLLFALAMAGGVHAQTISAVTVASCGAQSFGSNTFQPVEIDLTGNLCTNASSGSGVTISGPLGGLNQTDASGVRVSLSGSVPNTWTTPCTGALGDAGFLSCMITEMALPPTAYVSTTPTAEGGTADGSYADWWTDWRKVSGTTVLVNTGVTGAGSPRMTVAGDSATIAGSTPGRGYQVVGASTTATLQTSTGATGDYLSHCVAVPATTSPGVVQIYDKTNSGATQVYNFAGGTLASVLSWPIPVGAYSTTGGWAVTTGANVSVTCYGKFS